MSWATALWESFPRRQTMYTTRERVKGRERDRKRTEEEERREERRKKRKKCYHSNNREEEKRKVRA